MNQQRVKELIPIMTAYVNGQDIQVWSNRDDEWASAATPTFNDGRRYRIKPKPVSRPWSKPEDVPGPVCWIRPIGEPWNTYLIHTMGGSGRPLEYGDGYKQDYPIKATFEHSTDRKTWHPCTVTEELP